MTLAIPLLLDVALIHYINPLNAELNPICHLLILLGDLTFMGPCIVHPTRCNVTQFIYIWKLLYMFRVVLPPNVRSSYNYIYSIWYLSHRSCYLPLSWKSWNRLWVCCVFRYFLETLEALNFIVHYWEQRTRVVWALRTCLNVSLKQSCLWRTGNRTCFWNSPPSKLPYFSIDKAHLIYNAHPQIFRHSFWCMDNAHDAN
jgi:hypothetical protein